MTPMTDERLNQIPWDAKQEITRLRDELAETQAEMQPLAAHVQRDFEQVEKIARLLTRNEKLQAELADCQRQAAAMRFVISCYMQDSTACPFCGPNGHRDGCEVKDSLSGTAGRGFVPVEVADKLASMVKDMYQGGYLPRQFDMSAALSAYEAAKGHDGTPPTASAEERFEGVK